MKVVMAPQLGADLNPYQDLLQKGIEQADSGIKCTTWSGLSPRWLLERRKEIDVLHLHWLEYLYLSHTVYRTYRRFTTMVLALVFAKVFRKPIVYTVHNLAQHGKAYPALNWLGNRLIFRLADAIHVHDESGRMAVAAMYGRRERVAVIPHGSYIGCYPNHSTRDEARAWLSLPPESFVYLCLGQIRPHKGLESLLRAFGELESPLARLVIAGWPPDPSYGEVIRRQGEKDLRVTIHLRFVPTDEVQYYFNACDVCLLPYKTVTTSGAALLAFSFGKPIAAPSIGCFPELVSDARGILYDPEQPGSLRAALEAAQQLDRHKSGLEALTFARRLDWSSIGQHHASVYREMVAAGKRTGLPNYESRRR